MLRRTPLALLLSLTLTAPALAQGAPVEAQGTPLPMAATAKGDVAEGKPAVYEVTTAGAGVLAVALATSTSSEDVDLVLFVTDGDGQPLNEGRSDRDLHGDRGKEYLVALLPEAGSYLVFVEITSGERAAFTISGALAPAPDLAPPTQDPDGRPSRATAVAVGKAVEDTLGGADTWDWFALRAEAAGTLTILTKAPEGDLRLEAFAEGNYRQPIATSDQDLQDVKGNESVNITVQAGQTVYVRVSTFFVGGETVPYKVVSALIPD